MSLHFKVDITQPFPPKIKHLKAPEYELLACKISLLRRAIKLQVMSKTSISFFPEDHPAAFPATNPINQEKTRPQEHPAPGPWEELAEPPAKVQTLKRGGEEPPK